ncbi:MAG: 3'(2'),5'-bisphosphate nucleotidase [Micavibrio aeruginosavorus]|uniref:3'(2'),5'-bisphosphate nucleotidase CysQ n=1 Tax=Micavibrio aeruginosavorus TaxID=349221 RepID=A0A2W5MUA0_9BACT|nr:MAG: 3'(2'),5'-bisphosphate nucleotidase [Micavibrio aeruginosavorus]
MSKLLTHLPALCNMVKRTALEAGEITLDYFEEGMQIAADIKADGSPVTIADKRAEEYIIRALQDAVPGIPVIGEEANAAGERHDLKGQEYFWLVDPLDGTKEYAMGSPDYTVNIALIKNNTPVLGVIYAPAHGELFSAHGEGTAVRWLEETNNEKPIRVRKPSAKGLVVIASKNRSAAEIDKYLEEHKVEKIIRKGSSLKICAVAMGKADLYPGLAETCEWDTAAGHAILNAAGGEIVALDNGQVLTYGDKDGHFNNPKFLAQAKF